MRILGIDPGLQTTGFGVVDVAGHALSYVASGVIKTTHLEMGNLPARLKVLYDGIRELRVRYEPDEASVDAAVAAAERRFGRLRIAICNAGITDRVPVLEMSLDAFERVLRVNLVGCFLTARAAGRAIAAGPDPGGRIVTISSVSGQFGGTGRAAYGASKGGIEMLTRVLAVELAPHGILVNGVAPGPTQVARTAHGPRQRAAFLDRMAVKRYGTPDDVGAAVAFLCSGDNAFIAGQILNVDGGFASSGVMYDPAEGA